MCPLWSDSKPIQPPALKALSALLTIQFPTDLVPQSPGAELVHYRSSTMLWTMLGPYSTSQRTELKQLQMVEFKTLEEIILNVE